MQEGNLKHAVICTEVKERFGFIDRLWPWLVEKTGCAHTMAVSVLAANRARARCMGEL